jgi:hypothetical protein
MFAALAYLDLVTIIKTEHVRNIYLHLFMLMDAGLSSQGSSKVCFTLNSEAIFVYPSIVKQ